MSKRYLGDAVYAEVGGWGDLVLTTEDGIRTTNRIVLEPEVWHALLAYMQTYDPDRSGVSSSAELDLDRNDLVRLEVSGVDHDDEAKLWSRLRMKVKRTESAASPFPALAGVVGFRTGTTLFSLPEAG